MLLLRARAGEPGIDATSAPTITHAETATPASTPPSW
jgi:hypothetical protein